jgi:hypothetical protein
MPTSRRRSNPIPAPDGDITLPVEATTKSLEAGIGLPLLNQHPQRDVHRFALGSGPRHAHSLGDESIVEHDVGTSHPEMIHQIIPMRCMTIAMASRRILRLAPPIAGK